MFQLIQNYKLNPIYWDTDAFFLPAPLPSHLVSDSKELGKFRLVSLNNAVYFIGVKFYFYQEKLTNTYIHVFRGIAKDRLIASPSILIKRYHKALTLSLLNHGHYIEFDPLISKRSIEISSPRYRNKRRLRKKQYNNMYYTESYFLPENH